MSCTIDPKDFTIQVVRDKIKNKEYDFLIGKPTDTFEDVVNRLKILRGKVTTELIDNSQLVKGTHLDINGKTSRYVWIDTKELAALGRVTDATKRKFAKRVGAKRASEINQLPDSVIKRDGGTKFHIAMQEILYNIMKANSDKIFNPLDDSKEVMSYQEIQTYLGITNEQFKAVKESVEKIFKFIENTQKSIDPNGKFYINPEEFVLDPQASIGGTADLLAIYSNKTASLFDYKTITADYKSVDESGVVNSPNWISRGKLEDFNIQLPMLMDMYKKLGVKEFLHARIVPVQIVFKEKPKGDETKVSGARLTETIKAIHVDSNEFLSQIPIILEDTGNASLNKALEEANILKHNLNKRLSKYSDDAAEAYKLRGRIKKIDDLLNNIMIKGEMQGFVKLYKSVVEGYLDINRKLDAAYLEEGNTKYLTNDKINDLKDDLTIFESIALSLPDFISSLSENRLSASDKEGMFKAIDELNSKAGFIKSAINQLSININLTEDEQLARLGDRNLSMFDKLFRRFSNINNTIYNKVRTIIDTANNKTRLNVIDFTKKLEKLDSAVQTWGAANGLKGFKAYEPLIDKKSGNLHRRYKAELYSELEEARLSQDDKTLNELTNLKDNYKDIYEEALKKYMIIHSYTEADKESNTELITWMQENDPDSKISKVKYSDYWYKYYQVNESNISDDLFNPDYLNIKNNKALHDYYTFWEDSMIKFRDMLDLPYGKVPANFIPWVKANIIEQYMNGSLRFSKEGFKQLMSVEENNEISFKEGYFTFKSELDPDTGLAKREIPRYFVNPLVNNQGDIDTSLKSFDLSASMTVFAQTAFNYNNLKHTEATIEALKDILALQGVNQTNSAGQEGKINNSNKPLTEKGAQTDESRLLEDMINFHLYGLIYKDKPGKFAQYALSLKRYQQIKELGLAPLSSAVNVMGARSNALFEGTKGYFYTRGMWSKATVDRIKNKELFFSLANFIQPYQGSHIDTIAKKFKGNKIAKHINMDSMFGLFRNGDEHIDEHIMYAMLQNYYINKDGVLSRMNSKLREEGNFKSLLEGSRIEGDNLIIEGILDESGVVSEDLYRQLRNLILNTSMTIKGGLSNEDMNAANFTIMGKLMMSFKNWLPALAEERFRGVTNIMDKKTLRYNPQTNTVTEGRYTALLSDMFTDVEDKSVVKFMTIVSQSILKLTADIVTFGAFTSKGSALRYKVDETKARALYNKFLQDNPNLPAVKNGLLSFEDYLDYKQGQIRALVTELTFMLGIVILLAVMGGGFDDDDKNQISKKNWASRQIYKIMNRYRRELMGIVNPQDWVALGRNPLPILSLGNEALRTINNTFDEALDDLTGEREQRSLINPMGKKVRKDKTPRFYRTLNWVYGYKALKFFEPFEEDKSSKY